ncbi:MAG TPA: TetR/AcrR family transcriptional regulator [Bacteroidales bacterium]|nr:TetR/AcrR family transcriptional regulator [Bacteroidales bacterium]
MNDTREHILKTSLLLFLQKSYRDVTMNEIVEKTSLSKGAFYHYFRSKEELFKEIASAFFEKGAVDYSSFSKVSLHTFYNQYADFLNNSMLSLSSMVEDAGFRSFNFNYFVILFEAANRFPEFLKMELDLYKKDIKAWTKIISIARKKGEISSESTDEDIAGLFLYCNDGVFLRYVNSDKPETFRILLLNAYDTIYGNLKV